MNSAIAVRSPHQHPRAELLSGRDQPPGFLSAQIVGKLEMLPVLLQGFHVLCGHEGTPAGQIQKDILQLKEGVPLESMAFLFQALGDAREACPRLAAVGAHIPCFFVPASEQVTANAAHQRGDRADYGGNSCPVDHGVR